MANNIVAEAFIELNADTKKFDKAFKELNDKFKKGLDVNIDTKSAENKISSFEKKLKDIDLKPISVQTSNTEQAPGAGRGVATGLATATIAAATVAYTKQDEAVSKLSDSTKEYSIDVKSLARLAKEIELDFDGWRNVFEKLDTRLDNGSITLERYNSKLKNSKGTIEEINDKSKKLSSRLSFLEERNKSSWGSFGKSVSAAGSSVKSFALKATPTIAVVAGLGAAVLKTALATAKYADEIDNLSKQYKLGLETTQSLKILTEEAGLSFDTLGGVISKLRTTQAEAVAGNKTFIASYKALGLSISDIETLGPEQLLEKVAKQLAQGATDANVYAAGAKLLGEQFGRLQPILNDIGTKGLSGINRELSKFNDSTNQIIANDVAQQSWERLTRSVKKTFRQFGTGVLKALPGDYNAALQEAVDKRNEALKIEQEITKQQLEQARALRSKEAKRAAELEEFKRLDIVQGNKEYIKRREILRKTAEEEKKLQGLRIAAFSKLVNQRNQEIQKLNNLEKEEARLTKVNEYFSKQLEIVKAIKSTLTTIGAEGLVDAFQQTAFNPAVTRQEFEAAGSPSIFSSGAIERFVTGSERAIERAATQIERVGLSVDKLSTSVEKFADKIGLNNPSPIGI